MRLHKTGIVGGAQLRWVIRLEDDQTELCMDLVTCDL